MITYNFINVKQPPDFKSTVTWIEGVALELFPSYSDISYVFCADDDLLDINKKALAHDYYTDIITFDLRDNLGDTLSCEMYISLDRVSENASSFNCTFAEEMKRVMVHGLLHLSGMSDSTEEEKHAMREAENKFIFNQ